MEPSAAGPLHLAVDAKTGTIVASTVTSREVDDAAELGPLLDQVEEPLAAVVADGAYDQDRVYDGVAEHSAEAAVVVPPQESWLWKSEQRDKWSFCLKAASMRAA